MTKPATETIMCIPRRTILTAQICGSGLTGVREITYDESFAMASSKNKCEREIGAPVSRSKIANIDDTEYYFGDFVSSDGVYRTRIVGMDNIPHFPFGSMAAVTWEFLKHFSRDIKTGESIIDGKLPL